MSKHVGWIYLLCWIIHFGSFIFGDLSVFSRVVMSFFYYNRSMSPRVYYQLNNRKKNRRVFFYRFAPRVRLGSKVRRLSLLLFLSGIIKRNILRDNVEYFLLQIIYFCELLNHCNVEKLPTNDDKGRVDVETCVDNIAVHCAMSVQCWSWNRYD